MKPGQAEFETALAEIARIPGGKVRLEEPLARYTTFKIGGPARWLVDVPSVGALRSLLTGARQAAVSVHPLGLGSNVLFPDAGIDAVVVRLVGELKSMRVHGAWVSAGAGLALPHLARRSAQADLLGLEALSGFPSTVGGAVFMNAGCYGTEIRDVLVVATVIDGEGKRRRIRVADLDAGYRSTRLQREGGFVVGALFRLRHGDGKAALRRIDELNAKRWAALPSGVANAGSTFKNPPGDYAGRLIEACGLKGRVRGGAEISAKHANVFVNRGSATADDVLTLMLEARGRVWAEHGVALEPELVLAGPLARRWRDESQPEP